MYREIYNLPENCGCEKSRLKSTRSSRWRSQTIEKGFTCQHCGAYVYTLPETAGVQNRNHCPFCLWSRHLDYQKAGDRMSACKAVMQPIGLTIKPAHNKYACCQLGELMLIHRCSDCGKLSINRLAADDQSDKIAHIYHASLNLDEETLQHLNEAGIHPLLGRDEFTVVSRLYGNIDGN